MIEAIVGVALRAILASVLLGGVLAALVLVATRTLSLTAATRHALWTTALVATAVMPLAGIGVSLARATVASAPVAVRAPARTPAFASDGGSFATAPEQPSTFMFVDDVAPAQPRVNFAGRLALAWTPRLSRALAVGVVGVWALGALIGLIGLAGSVARVRGLKRRSSPLDGALADELPWLTEVGPGREIYLRLSYETETPVAIGFRRPVILIPTELASADGLGAIEPLILHEHAHLRRNDDWTNLLQRAIERVLWFNPVVWLVGRRIALEREIASDDAVVEKTGEAHAYATSLWRLAREMRMPEHAVVAPGALLTRKQITVRIEQLLDKKRARLHRSPVAALGVALAAAFAIAFVASSAPAVELPSQASPVIATNVAAHSAAPAHHRAPAHVRATVAREKLPAKHLVAGVARASVRLDAAERTWKTTWTSASKRAANTTAAPANDAQAKAMRAQLKALRDELAAAKNSVAVAPEHTLPIAQRMPPLAPVMPALPPMPALPTTPALTPQAVAKIQGATAAAHARYSARWRYGPEIERTLKLAMESIPHEVAVALSAQVNARANTVVRRMRFDGMKLTRDMIASCTGCSFRNADARGLDLHDLKLTAANFSGADMRGVNLAGAKLAGVLLSHANLANADLRGAVLSGVELRDANFDGAQLEGIRLTGVAIGNTSLRGTMLRNVMANCLGCEFSGLDLRGQDLHGLMLTGANFNHADLRDANLSGVHFVGVDLSHANLSGADLTNAYLETCDLNGTDLRNARTAGMTTRPGGLDG